jgi:hypothetical protein
MSKIYDRFAHTHVTVRHPDARNPKSIAFDAWRGTFPIVLYTNGDRVWIAGSQMHEGHEYVHAVRDDDGPNFAADVDGNCILSIPASWCDYHTPEAAECIERCIDADDAIGP